MEDSPRISSLPVAPISRFSTLSGGSPFFRNYPVMGAFSEEVTFYRIFRFYLIVFLLTFAKGLVFFEERSIIMSTE